MTRLRAPSNRLVQNYQEARMTINPSKMKLRLLMGAGFLAIGSVIAYAAIFVYRYGGTSDYIGLRGGPAQVTARELLTPAGEVGTWHYHPGFVYNVVTQGTITIEDGCRGAQPQTFGV